MVSFCYLHVLVGLVVPYATVPQVKVLCYGLLYSERYIHILFASELGSTLKNPSVVTSDRRFDVDGAFAVNTSVEDHTIGQR